MPKKRAIVDDWGGLSPEFDAWFRKNLTRFRGQIVTVSIDAGKKTIPQLGYWWAVIVPTIAEWMGHDPEDQRELEEVHADLMEHLWPEGRRMRYNIFGDPVSRRASLAEMSKQDATALIDRAIRFAAENGVVIEEANRAKWN